MVASGTVGLWALAAPRSFYDDFPGMGRVWVAVDGPFNEHLVRDVGALNLALAFVAAMALATGSVLVARAAGGAALIYGVPHLVYHAFNHVLRHRRLGGHAGVLAFAVLAGVVALAAPRRRAQRRRTPEPSPSAEVRGDLFDDGVHALEARRAVPEGEVGDVTSSRPRSRHAATAAATSSGVPATAGPAGLLPEGGGLGGVVGEQEEGLGGAGDLAQIAADRLAAALQDCPPLGDGGGQAPHVPLVGVAGHHLTAGPPTAGRAWSRCG